MQKQFTAKQVAKIRECLMCELRERGVITFTKNENYEYWFVSCEL